MLFPVKIQSTHGFEVTYALLDPGSQVTLMKSSMARRLNLRGRQIKLNINTAVGSRPIESQEISFMLNSLDGKESIEIPNAYIITALPFDNAPELPVGSLDRWDHLKGIHLPHAPNKEITMPHRLRYSRSALGCRPTNRKERGTVCYSFYIRLGP